MFVASVGRKVILSPLKVTKSGIAVIEYL